MHLVLVMIDYLGVRIQILDPIAFPQPKLFEGKCQFSILKKAMMAIGQWYSLAGKVHLRDVLKAERGKGLNLCLFFRFDLDSDLFDISAHMKWRRNRYHLKHSIHSHTHHPVKLLHPLWIFHDERLLEQLLTSFNIVLCHFETALIR